MFAVKFDEQSAAIKTKRARVKQQAKMDKPLAVVRAHLIDLAPRDKSDRAGDQLVKYAHLVARIAADKEIYQPASGRLVLLDKFKLAVRVHRLFRVGADEKYVPKLVADRGDLVGFLPNLRLFK